MNETDRDGGFPRTGRLRLNELETVIVRGGEAVSRGQRCGGEDGAAP